MEPCGSALKIVQRCLADVARKPVDHVDIYLGDEANRIKGMHAGAGARRKGQSGLERLS